MTMNPIPTPRTFLPAVALITALALALPALAADSVPPPVPGGRIGTLEMGDYTCELPGDAGGSAGTPVPEYAFRVVNASSYKAGGVRGSYLLAADRVTMTGGKLKGLRLHRISSGFLRRIADDGSDGPMRCVLTSRR